MASSNQSEKAVFIVERELIVQLANQIVKPLLTIVNQERVYYLKKRSAQSLVTLLHVSKQHKLHVLSHKTLLFVL